MRKPLLLTVVASLIIINNVRSQYVNIPDSLFRLFLQQNYPACMNAQGQLDTTCSTILSVQSLLVSSGNNTCSFRNLTGLQYFKNVNEIYMPLNACLEVFPVINSLKKLKAQGTRLKLSWLPNGLKVFDVGTNDGDYSLGWNEPFINDNGHLPDSLEYFSCKNAYLSNMVTPPLPAGLQFLDISSPRQAFINSLPSLPPTLRYLNCRNLSLAALPTLPASLTYLNCSADPPFQDNLHLPAMPPQLDTFEFYGRLMKELPAMPSSLTYFSCWGTDSTTTFPAMPEGLKVFQYLNAPRLRSMPVLPNSIIEINCFEVGLSSLVTLPASLKKLVFNLDTALHYLPPFPEGLQHIECYNNRLLRLPDLPSTVNWLSCTGNQLSYLPLLPDGLRVLYCDNNRIQALKQIPPSLTYLNIVNNQLNCLPYFPVPTMPVNLGVFADPTIQCISSSNPYLRFYHGISSDTVKLPECNPSNNVNHCETHPVISGYVFYDRNNNAIKDSGEDGKSNVKVALTPGSNFTFSDNNGHYEISTDSLGLYSITPEPWTYFFDFVPASAGFDFSTYDTVVYKDFAITPNTTIDSLSVNITCVNIPRPGFPVGYHVTYTNTGTTTLVNPVLTIAYDDTRLTFDSSAVAGLNHTGNNLILNASGMTPLEQGNLTAWFRVKPTTPIGDSLIAGASLAANSKIATSFSRVIIRGSFDPNDKQATAQLSPLQVINGDYIDYTIRFQNTGTDTAFNVVIADTLDENIKTSSLQLMATSHNCKTTVIDNMVYFEFLHILLPDSNINEPLSHGFVSFRLQPQNSVAVNSIIPNKAAIYFDYNSPVITNTAGTLIKNFTVVPLRLISFSAVAQTENTTSLSWITSNEINTQYFKIERSNDGLQFDYITTITAKGKAYNNYNTVLNGANTGIVYYRLKIMDKDGSFVYSPVIKIDNRKNTTGIIILSNPVKGFLNINAADRNVHNTAAGIINMQGAVVKTFILKEGSQTIDLGGLPPGMYYIRTTSGNEKFLLR